MHSLNVAEGKEKNRSEKVERDGSPKPKEQFSGRRRSPELRSSSEGQFSGRQCHFRPRHQASAPEAEFRHCRRGVTIESQRRQERRRWQERQRRQRTSASSESISVVRRRCGIGIGRRVVQKRGCVNLELEVPTEIAQVLAGKGGCVTKKLKVSRPKSAIATF